MDLKVWLTSFFAVLWIRGNEATVDCPQCGKPKFYFNLSKKIGYCHVDDCIYHINPPSLEDLVEHIGFGPDEEVFVPVQKFAYVQSHTPVTLPGKDILTQQDGELFTSFPRVVHMLKYRMTLLDAYRFKLTWDGSRIYLPVFHKNELVSWLGRAAWWFEHDLKPKYLNAPDTLMSDYLFNTNECLTWKELCLVENTFNAINMRDDFNTTSTFGSNLSRAQISLICGGAAESVAILWDRGAEKKAEDAVVKLRAIGIPAAFGWIQDISRSQPDDFGRVELREAIASIHATARTEKLWTKILH